MCNVATSAVQTGWDSSTHVVVQPEFWGMTPCMVAERSRLAPAAALAELAAAACRTAVTPQHHQLFPFLHCKIHSGFKSPFNSTANLHASQLPGCASPQSCFVFFALNKRKKMVNKNFCRYILFLRPSEASSSALTGLLLIRLTLLVTLALNVSAVWSILQGVSDIFSLLVSRCL